MSPEELEMIRLTETARIEMQRISSHILIGAAIGLIDLNRYARLVLEIRGEEVQRKTPGDVTSRPGARSSYPDGR